MADLTANVSVAIESAVHAALRELAQSVFDKHGVIIEAVNIKWICIGGTGGSKYVVSDIHAHTWTDHEGK